MVTGLVRHGDRAGCGMVAGLLRHGPNNNGGNEKDEGGVPVGSGFVDSLARPGRVL